MSPARLCSWLFVLLLAELTLSACHPIQAPSSTIPPGQRHGLLPAAPAYAVHGPYAVGVQNFVVEPTLKSERPLTVTVWYPAVNPQGLPEAITYTLGFPTNQNPNFPIVGHAIPSAEPALSGAPYPLVVYSHAYGTYRQQAAYLTEHLASQGFVVMATDHEDNWGTLGTVIIKSEYSRPRDVTRQIDFAENLTRVKGALEGLIDTQRVAVAGWSMGGETAMEMAGARLNLAEWQQTYCKAFPDDGDCSDYRDRFDQLAQVAGLAAAPAGLWPDWSDPRVDVIVPMAPNANMFGGGGLDNLHAPALLMVGSADDRAGPGIKYRNTFTALPSASKTRVSFKNGGHMIFMETCAHQPGMAEAGFDWVCKDPTWNMDHAHDLINHFVTAFLLATLKGDGEAAKALAPENVSFPQIDYETTGILPATPAQ